MRDKRIPFVTLVNTIDGLAMMMQALESDKDHESNMEYNPNYRLNVLCMKSALAALKEMKSERSKAIRFYNNLVRKAKKHPDKAKAFKFKQKAQGVQEIIKVLYGVDLWLCSGEHVEEL